MFLIPIVENNFYEFFMPEEFIINLKIGTHKQLKT